jgi:hypothetical protein
LTTQKSNSNILVSFSDYIYIYIYIVFHSKTTGKEYTIFCNVNCKTPIVVYLLDCHVCGSQYVGESVQPFNKMETEVTLRKRRTMCSQDTHWMTLLDSKLISLTTIPVGKRIKDKKERVFGSASYKHYIRRVIKGLKPFVFLKLFTQCLVLN